MPRLLLLVAIVFALWYWWTNAKQLPPEKRKQYFWRSGLWLALIISVVLVATGRMHWIGAGLAALALAAKSLLNTGVRVLPFLQMWGRMKGGPSQFATRSLKVEIDFASGQIDGEILQGEFRGRRLSDLGNDELEKLGNWLRENDRESFVLYQAYLLRRGRGGAQSQQQYHQQQNGGWSDVSREEAYKILGLEPNAGKEEIIKAHRRLIQKLHPDRGGNDYLAAKINAAKDRLLD